MSGPTALLASYLSRVGIRSQPTPHPPMASLATLSLVQRRHLAVIPYDNLAIMVGRPEPIDAVGTIERLGRGGPGGYCFHQNPAFARILCELGLHVELRTGRLWRDAQHRAAGGLLHPVPVVHDLPTATNPGGTWWADVGLGDGPLDPIPLLAGEHTSGDCAYRVERTTAGWTLHHHALGSFAGVDLEGTPLDHEAARATHETLATPPGAFTRRLVVQRPVEGGSVTLRGRVLTTVAQGNESRRHLADYPQWCQALADLGLATHTVTGGDLRAVFGEDA